jgi:hypothetical protein
MTTDEKESFDLTFLSDIQKRDKAEDDYEKKLMVAKL